MDSPIFGHSKKSKQYQKNYNLQDYNTDPSENLPSDWYLSNKGNYNAFNNSRISTELKMAYTFLILQKNINTFFSKLNKSISRKKYQAFKNIERNQNPKLLAFPQIQSKDRQSKNAKQQTNNLQTRMYTQICLKQTYQKLSNICRIINRIQLKKMSRGWFKISLQSEKNRYKTETSLHVGSIMQQTDLAISSKIESKKHLNSKKHAKQMKENSLINRTNSDYEAQNEKLVQQITMDQYQLERFQAKLNNLLASHQNKLASDSDRQTRMSDNLIYQNTFQNHHNKPINGTKSQLYTKKK